MAWHGVMRRSGEYSLLETRESDQEEHEKGAHAGQAYARETHCEIKCMNTATLPQARGLHECAPHFNEVPSLDYSRSSNASPNSYCAQDSL